MTIRNIFKVAITSFQIGQEIASHLPLEDLKAASLACRPLHGMVRSSPRFSTMSALHLTSCTEDGDKVRIVKDAKWPDIQLTSNSWGLVELDTRVAKETEFLWLSWQVNFYFAKICYSYKGSKFYYFYIHQRFDSSGNSKFPKQSFHFCCVTFRQAFFPSELWISKPAHICKFN